MLAVEEGELKYGSACHQIQPYAIMVSMVLVSLSILDRLLCNNPLKLGSAYLMMVVANLLILLFVIG